MFYTPVLRCRGIGLGMGSATVYRLAVTLESPRYGRLRDLRRFTAWRLSILSHVRKPRIDENLILLTDFGQAEAICTEIFDDPARDEGVLLKVMTRGPFEQGQQVWILDEDGSKVGAIVEGIFKHSIDSELTLSTVLPA